MEAIDAASLVVANQHKGQKNENESTKYNKTNGTGKAATGSTGGPTTTCNASDGAYIEAEAAPVSTKSVRNELEWQVLKSGTRRTAHRSLSQKILVFFKISAISVCNESQFCRDWNQCRLWNISNLNFLRGALGFRQAVKRECCCHFHQR